MAFLKSLSLFLLLGFIAVFVLRYRQLQSELLRFTPEHVIIKTTPPPSSLTGTITYLNGTVSKFSRNTTDFAPLTSAPAAFLQGEALKTAVSSEASLEFPDLAVITLSPLSQINLINTNPDSFLVNQVSGEVNYALSDASAHHLSVRLLHLLVELDAGSALVTVDGSRIDIYAPHGSLRIAYEDKDNTTRIVDLTGRHMIFNDSSRSYLLRRR